VTPLPSSSCSWFCAFIGCCTCDCSVGAAAAAILMEVHHALRSVVDAFFREAQTHVEFELTVNRSTGKLFAMSIQSFACPDTEGLFTTGKCRRFVNIKSVAERKLAQLDAAPSVSFMKAPPGNDLKEYDGAWHVRINDQWRLTFKWGESGPYDVRIEDPH